MSAWALDPGVVHLNHGSFGGCLRSVLAVADSIRARVEAAPMQFYLLAWQRELDAARAVVAAFVGAAPAQLVFVPNATSGVALALQAAAAGLATGDEIVTTSHAYPACRALLDRAAAARGAHVVVVETPLPFDADALVERVAGAITARTKLALVDHVTSPSAFVYPIARLVALFAARGIPVLVDGAHAPGQVPLAVGALGATWYVGNHHKWLCAPKASGFVAFAEPPARLHAEHDWTGTHDPSAQLAVPAAIAAVAAEAGGDWAAVMARNHARVLALRDRLTSTRLAADADLGAMAIVPLALPAGLTTAALEQRLLADGIEVPVHTTLGRPVLRVSAHLYTRDDDADRLAAALHALGVCLL